MSADELSVRLTARDEISGKIKDTKAHLQSLLKEAQQANKMLDQPGGAKRYEQVRAELEETNRSLKRQQLEMGRNEKALRDMGTTGAKAAEKTRKSWTTATKLGIAAAATAATVAAKKMWSAAKDFAASFADQGKQVITLQRLMGGTAQDASGMAAAFRLSGIDAVKGQQGIKLFSKQITGADSDIEVYQAKVAAAAVSHKAFTGKLGKSAATFGALGIAVKGANGKVRSTKDLLLDTAKAFEKMPDGADKTAYAMKLFGKSGADLLPFLNKGKKGVKELFDQSKALGTTMSDKDLQGVKDYTKAQRGFNEAMLGVKITLGREVFPTLTRWMKMLGTQGVPLLRSTVEWTKRNSTAVKTVASVLGIAIVVIGAATLATKVARGAMTAWTVATKIAWAAQVVWTNAQIAFNLAMEANPIGLVIVAIAALIGLVVLAYKHWGWFRKVVQGAWAGIKSATSAAVGWFRDTAWPAIKTVLGWIGAYYRTMWGVAKTVWNGVVGTISGAVNRIKAIAGGIRSVFSGVWSSVKNAAKAAFDAVKSFWNSTVGGFHVTVFGKTIGIPAMATGGPVTAGMTALIGEVGPELFVPTTGRARVIGSDGPSIEQFATSGVIIPNHMLPQAAPVMREPALVGAGPSVHIGTINAASGVDVEDRVLHAMLRADRISRERR